MQHNPIYEKNTLEFVTVALEYISMIETSHRQTLSEFSDKAVKILPLLYLKGTLIPKVNSEETSNIEHFITEDTYEIVRNRLANLLGEHDSFLETFHPDMTYSDTPIATTISENLADVYQDLGDFAASFRQENENVMRQALYECRENFRLYWGQKLLNALKALHSVNFFDNEDDDSTNDDDNLNKEK